MLPDTSVDVERHDGAERATCVGQWCCGCAEHPSGKPWGWNYRAWDDHRAAAHPTSREQRALGNDPDASTRGAER